MGNYGVAYALVALSIKILAYWLRKETSKISIVFEVACSYTHRFHLLYCVLFIWKSPFNKVLCSTTKRDCFGGQI